jgi:DNA polymerase-3 subunit alpha
MKDGDLDGVFQFSSHLYKGIIEEVLSGIEERGDESVARDLFNIIVALEALGRPGPLKGGMVPEFAKGLAAPETVSKVHPVVDNILEETYGNMLYQEQIMFILQQLGGFSLGQADMVRRGIASGFRELIEEQRTPFLDGVKAVQLKNKPETDEEEMSKLLKLANHIFDLMAFWSEYGFNKAHSVGYGFLSLRGAWLKAHYKVHFMAALISANSKNEDRVIKYIDEIRSRGVNVLQPKINRSLKGFTVHGEDILFGLQAIKGVGPKAIDDIIAGYPYKNFADFTVKVGNRRTLLPLIKAGYFEEDKRFLLKYWEVVVDIKDGKTKLEESIIDYLVKNGFHSVPQEEIEKKLENLIYQKSLRRRTEKTRNETLNLINRKKYSHIDLLNMEKDTLGMFLSESPLDSFKDMIYSNTTLANEIKNHKMNEEFFIIGIVLETPPVRIDKNGNKMCFLKLQMYDGIVDMPVFAGSYGKCKDKLIEGNIIISKAKKIRGGLTINRVADLIEKESEFKQFFGME